MKLTIFAVCLVTLSILASSSTAFKTVCGATNCGEGQICVCRGGISSCVLLAECSYVAVVQTAEKTWFENGCEYTLYRVNIVNYGRECINNIILGTDCTLDVKQGNIWNIQITPIGDLTLPPYARGIPGGASHSFGYIVRGHTSPNFFIKAIVF
eukprot:gene3713-4626_t